MHDTGRVRGFQAVGDLDGEGDDGAFVEFSSSQAIPQAHAFEILHHDEQPAILFPDVMNRTDVRVQSRGRLSL
jgi:hypothetical protein